MITTATHIMYELPLTILEQSHVVPAKCLDQLLCHVHLAEGELVMVAVVQDVQQVRVERMNVLKKARRKQGTNKGKQERKEVVLLIQRIPA